MEHQVQLPRGKYLIIRLALWLIAVVIASLPAMFELHDFNDLLLGEKFSDLLFVVVPVSALALSTTIDYLCVGFPRLSAGEFFNSLCSLLLNSIGLIAALTGFVAIADGPMPATLFRIYCGLIGISVVAGLITECVVTWNHHGFRPRTIAISPGAGPQNPSDSGKETAGAAAAPA